MDAPPPPAGRAQTRHTWFGPMPKLPAGELLDTLEKDGWDLVQIVPTPMQQPDGQVAIAWMCLMRRREAPRVLLPH